MRHWLLIGLLAGCATLRDKPGDSGGAAVFPHPGGYDEPLAHGAEALAGGNAACFDCHEDGGPSPCSECHDLYPHQQDMILGSVHGSALLDGSRSQEECDACHAAPGLQAFLAAACTNCHASYPHPDGWGDAGQHGLYAVDRGGAVAACGDCHGGDLGGGDSGVSCSRCYGAYPHAADISDPAVHGAAWLENAENCTACHGGDGTALPVGQCNSCHWPYPHASTFDHIAATGITGETACMGCHDEGDGTAGIAVTCSTACHGGEE